MRTYNKAKRTKSLLFLLTVLIIFQLIASYTDNIFTNEYENEKTPDYKGPQDFKIAQIGEDSWWNVSYQWRQCINITNPGAYNLTDNFINIQVDYATLRDNYNMDPDLYDVRIVENNLVRNYYVKKDFPTNDIATIWFETNSSAGESDYDTYMYWGNASINYRGSNHVNYDPSGTSWWSFEEGSGGEDSTVIDSLNFADAHLYGTGGNFPDYDTDSALGSYSLNFNGGSDYVYINDSMHFTEPNEIDQVTVSCWFKTLYTGSSYSSNWAFFDFDRSEYFNFYIRGDDGRIGFSSAASGYSGQNDFYSDTYDLNNGEWHFACVVYDGTDKIIYIDDGVEDARWVNAMGGRGFGTGNDRWGFFGDGSEASLENGGRNNIYYDGNLDEIRYFEYAVDPDEIKWLANYYTIETDLLPVTERAAAVTIIIKDVDGQRVPGAVVSLWKNATHILEVDGYTYTDYTLSDGTVSFTKVPFGFYNITVNYTISSGEAIVYDSRIEPDGQVEFKGLMFYNTLYTDLWTINFDVDDWDGDPLNYGYINISAGTSDVLESLLLDSSGKATFRWLNRSSYNYTIYYDNLDYVIKNPTPLNASTITRESIKTTYLVNNTNIDAPGTQTYSVNEDTYLEGSGYGNPGNITAIDASVRLSKMDNLTQVRIFYIDDTGHTFKELRDYTGLASSDTFIYHPGEEETYEVFGLKLEIDGANSTQCNGIMEVSLSYAYTQYARTNMSKLSIRVIDDTATVPVEGIIVRAEINGTDDRVVDLKTDDNGYAYGLINDNLGFWYKREITYNFSLWIVTEQRTFKINYSDQWFNEDSITKYYNYTLNEASSLVFELDLNYQNRLTRFQNGSLVADTSVTWGQNMTYSIIFEYSDDAGFGWDPDDNSGTTVTCTIKSSEFGNPTVFEDSMEFQGSGNFSIRLNSSDFSAGDYGKTYFVIISGKKLFYYQPPDQSFSIFISSLATSMSLHNYSSMPTEIPTNTISQKYNEVINVTVKYYDSSTSNSLTAEIVTYDWDYGSGPINQDPINLGYYTFELNTSLAPIVGIYKIDITAALENHTKIDDFEITLNILLRPTEINGTNNIIFLSEDVYALETEYFEFNYTDVLTPTRISNPDEASYNWQKLDEFGDPIPGENKIGTLIETADHRYILDLDTESMELGDYFVFITLDKLNYELRSAVISLTIEDRPTSVNGSIGTFIINMGDTLNFTYSYFDDLINTSITNLETASYTYNGTASGSGSLEYDAYNEVYYLLGFNTASLPNGTYTITVIFDKQNYTSQVIASSLVINYIITDYRTFLTLISQNPSNFTTDVYWRDEVTVSFNFTTQYQSNPQELAHPTTISIQFLDESLSALGSSINLINHNTSKGIYSYTFNTSQFLFIGGESYYINIYASLTEPPHTPPTPLLIFFKVQSVLTTLTIHNYTTGTEFPSYTLTEYWNQTLGITIYFRELISSAPITNADVTYSWADGSGQINPDAIKGPGYYSFFFDTGNATDVGTYTINILAVKQNFSTGVPNPSLIINIINRPTLLRPTGVLGNESVIFLSAKIYALETEYFEFNYTDVFSSMVIKNADLKSYTWQKLDEFGDPIPGETRFGTLIETIDHIYILDLDTESMEVGEYFIIITLDKLNYELRSAVISLMIEARPTEVNGSIGTFIINMGDTLNFTYSFIDNLTSTPITNLDMGSYTYNGTASGSGSLGYDAYNEVYYLSGFNTASLLNGTYTITVTFEIENYASQVVVSTLVINYIITDYRTFLTLISQNPSNFTTNIYWRDEVTVSFNFTTQYQSNPQELAHPTTMHLQFLDESLNALGSSFNLISYNTSKGIYSYTFNTSQFLFIGGESYYISIYASKTTPTPYTPPTPLMIFFKVQSALTTLTIHNYTTGTEFPSYTLTEYWNQTLGITFYFGELISSAPITNAYVTYSWAFGSGQISPDAIKGPGYYSFFFNTGNVTEVGTYTINILAVKQNFSNGVPSPSLIINIINRPTLLEGNGDVLYLSQKLFALDPHNFTFEFTDVLSLKIIKNADEKSFILVKLDANGDPIPGSTITGSLHETVGHQYVLDLDTETLQEGEYSIVVTLNKDNYDFRVAIISLTINKREFSLLFSVGTIINLASGGTVQFQITLTDPNNSSVPVIGADLTLTIRGIVYTTSNNFIIDNGDGTYTVNTFPIAEPFFMPETFIATLTIGKANFTSETHNFTVVVSIAEIFPGMPTFYFLLIVGSIAAVAGSLVSYRLIQQRRIPTFVKKAKSMKKDIKGNKTISESLLYPTKEEYIVKMLGDKWEDIGLSLRDVMGLKAKKKKLPVVKEEKPKKLPKEKEEKLYEPEEEKEEKLYEPEEELDEPNGGDD